MTETPGSAPAGWYPDPEGSPQQRYFDGTSWTDNFEPSDTVAAAAGGGAPEPKLSPFDYWKKVVLENYFNFKGRARRSEYWWSYLISAIIMMVIYFIFIAILGDIGAVIGMLVALVLAIPMIAAAVRRLHDTGRSGWWYFIALVPFVGGIILLVFLASDSKREANQWGRSPKYG